MFQAAEKTICFEEPPCFSPAWHWLPTYTFLGGIETYIWSELKSSKTGWIHRCAHRRLSHLWVLVLLGHFASWFWHIYRSDVEDHLWALIAISAFLPVGFDVCRWGPFVSTIWVFLPIGSDIWAPLRTVYFGKVFVWYSVLVTLREGLWPICHLVCECIFHLCDWYSCCLCKMGNSASIH